MTRIRLVAACAAVLALSLSASSSEAQFGDALKRAAKKKAEEQLKGKPPAQPEATPAGQPQRGDAAATYAAPVPKFDGTTLEITQPVLDRFLTAMAAEKKARADFEKERSKSAEFEATIDKYERCVQKKMDERNAEGSEQHIPLYMNYWQAIMRGDTTTSRVLGDSLVKLGFASPEAACGKRPVEAYKARSRMENESSEVEGAGADAGNFSVRQYSVMKERVFPFVEAENRKQPIKGGFTEGEQAVMRAKITELTAAFKDELGKK